MIIFRQRILNTLPLGLIILFLMIGKWIV